VKLKDFLSFSSTPVNVCFKTFDDDKNGPKKQTNKQSVKGGAVKKKYTRFNNLKDNLLK
jgi:hypothetical protein